MCACDFGTGRLTCHCPACHRTFTGFTPFDRHQLLDPGGGVICQDPGTVFRADGLPVFRIWRLTPDGQPVWGRALGPGEHSFVPEHRGIPVRA